jgi:hypothetical protein
LEIARELAVGSAGAESRLVNFVVNCIKMVSYRRVGRDTDRHMPLSPLKRLTRNPAWLSVTPEPEGELPSAIAALRAGAEPSPTAVAAERRRVERLVLRGRRRAWCGWISEARELAERRAERQPREARIALDVIDNHDALCLGLAGRGRGMGRGRGTR